MGAELTAEMEAYSIELYMGAAELAWQNGIIIADTKLEWGLLPHLQNTLILIDEVFTPDSSRFWPLAEYKLNESINSFDKQFVRDWISQSGWDKQSPPDPLPEEVILKTRDKYVEAYNKLTGLLI